MKKIILFAILLVAAAMTACTDYKAQINDAHDECVNALPQVSPGFVDGGEIENPLTFSETVNPSLFENDPIGNCGNLWCGLTDVEGVVVTGLHEKGAASWYDYNDSGEGGNSVIYFPNDIVRLNGNSYGPLVQTYHGIVGSVLLQPGYDYPFAALGFNIVNDDMVGGNITGWGGLCVVYQSSIQIRLIITVEDEETNVQYNNYKVYLPVSNSMTVAEFSWSKFKQESGWGIKMSRDEVLTKVAAIKFEFSESAGTAGDFRIQSVGTLGSCN